MYYISEKKDDKYGVKCHESGEVKHYTKEELKNFMDSSKDVVFGAWKQGYDVIELEEYQELKWGELTVFSFYDNIGNTLYTGVKDNTSKVLYFNYFDSYVEEMGVDSLSDHRNGDLECIFEEGEKTKCIGYTLWLDYARSGSSEYHDPGNMCTETYLEYHTDGSIHEVAKKDWNFDEYGAEHIYDSEKDCISVRYSPRIDD